ncbi:MAG: hypothetical protein ABFS09_01020 [Thermodesulfobacteriota bacterium]
MKIISLCFFLVLGLAACSDNQQEKIDKFNEKKADKATDYIQQSLDKAKDVQKLAEEKYKDSGENQE